MDFIRSHKLIAATIAIQIIALPLIVLVVKTRQNNTITKATAASTLSFAPQTTANTPLTKNVNDDVSVDLMLDPGTNLISLAKIDLTYDATKFTVSDASKVVVNATAFPVTVEGPVLSSGRVQIVVSVGSDQTKVIQTSTKVLTLTLKAIAPVSSTQIGFGTANSLLSIAAGDSANENVLSTTVPAFIKVNAAPTTAPTATPTNSPTPTITPTNTPTLTPTKTPTPTPSPTPAPTAAPSNTPTPTLASTVLTFTGLRLHGLGKGGDTPNPNSAGTLTLLRPTRVLTVELYNSAGALVNTSTGNLTYTGSTTGLFNGSINLPTSVAAGAYLVKIKTPFYLRKQLPGFLQLNLGTTTELISNQQNPVALVAGDVDSDNKLETSDDYDLIMECFTDLLPAKSTCDSNKKTAADISDDGKVNQDDYNLFLRELSVQQGE